MDLDTILNAPFLDPEHPIPESKPVKDIPTIEEVVLPKAKEDEVEEKSWRNKVERSVLDRYPELAEFHDLQEIFLRLKTMVFIVKQSLTDMLPICAFSGKAWWSEEEAMMTDFSSFRRTKLKIKNTEFDELVKRKLAERKPAKTVEDVESGNGGDRKEDESERQQEPVAESESSKHVQENEAAAEGKSAEEPKTSEQSKDADL